MRKIKILIITYLPWREDNSIGNSYSNIFKGTDKDKYEFAHIYVRDGKPQNELCHKYYHISEKKTIERWVMWKQSVGKSFYVENCKDNGLDNFSSLYNKARILRWEIFFLIRMILTSPSFWKTKDFDNFLDEFKPDIIFGTLPNNAIISKLMLYVKNKYNIPLITYPWDDHYSFNSHQPIYSIGKLIQRYYLRKTASESEFMYVISNLMQNEYSILFKKECKLLFKGHHFNGNKEIFSEIHPPINIVYMGNIGGGRWKTLAVLAKAVDDINSKYDKTRITLNIYTLSPIDYEIEHALNIKNSSKLNNAVPNEKVNETMDGADILVHAEPYSPKDYKFYRASFSTKLVDYFFRAKAILSIGGMTASTDYLIKNDATIYVQKDDIVDKLHNIVKHPEILNTYAQKSWDCGVRNHQINDIQNKMYNDFKRIVGI